MNYFLAGIAVVLSVLHRVLPWGYLMARTYPACVPPNGRVQCCVSGHGVDTHRYKETDWAAGLQVDSKNTGAALLQTAETAEFRRAGGWELVHVGKRALPTLNVACGLGALGLSMVRDRHGVELRSAKM